jgi:YfiH family protein
VSDRADIISEPGLASTPDLRHAFFTRNGGVSPAPFDSLNCGFRDGEPRANILENRRRAAAVFDRPVEALCTVRQVHGRAVARMERPWIVGDGPEADAMVTDRPGIVLGVLTADCAPLLFADAEARVVGAAHAGWRGALDGVAEATLEAMAELGAATGRTVAAIGPCIQQISYEVGPEFPQPFRDQDEANMRHFHPAPREGHFHFDLPGYLAARLEKLGLASVAVVARDTCAEAESFFSYRRACLEGDRRFGSSLSAIALGG